MSLKNEVDALHAAMLGKFKFNETGYAEFPETLKEFDEFAAKDDVELVNAVMLMMEQNNVLPNLDEKGLSFVCYLLMSSFEKSRRRERTEIADLAMKISKEQYDWCCARGDVQGGICAEACGAKISLAVMQRDQQS